MLDLFVLHTTPAAEFFLGENGWFYLTGDDSRASWRGLRRLAPEKLEAWRKALEARRDRLKEQGIEYVYVVAPNKQSIYPEHLPESEHSLGPTPLDQLQAWLAARSDVSFLDLRPALLAEKTHDRPEQGDFVFHKLGMHWSSRGAWAAVQAVVAKLAERFPDLKPAERSGYASIGSQACHIATRRDACSERCGRNAGPNESWFRKTSGAPARSLSNSIRRGTSSLLA